MKQNVEDKQLELLFYLRKKHFTDLKSSDTLLIQFRMA